MEFYRKALDLYALLRNWPINLSLSLVLSRVLVPRAPSLSLPHCAVGLVVTLK